MMLFNKISRNITLLNSCFFHTTQQKAAIGKTMRKVMGGTKKKKRIYSEEPILPNSNAFTKDLFTKHNTENSRRISVLNKLFMTHITDLMTTGEYATQFAGYGIEINRVKVTPDYHGINVYWIAKETANDEIENLLQSKSGLLRHELSQLHLIGNVPKIKFVKDKEYARFMEVDSRLAYADFGEDFEPAEASVKLKSYLELKKTLDSKLKEKIISLEETHKFEENEEIPPMPQNVLGLNHSDIMDRIKKSMKKSQASHRCQGDVSEDPTHSFNPDPIEVKSAKAQREAFKQFLAER